MSTMGTSRLWGKITVLVAVCGWGLSAQAKYDGGSGEPNNPYQISSVADWQELMATPADWASHFVLTADLDVEGIPLSPVGIAYSAPFTGVFDGRDYVIRNADVNMPGSNYVGLFGYLGTGGQIKNLGVEDVSIFGRSCVGGLVGFKVRGAISNCYSTGTVSGTGYYVGGLVGHSLSGTIDSCHSSSGVSGDSCVGGLVGCNDGMITDCYSTGSVSGPSGGGGLVGYNGGTITNCYSTGNVTGTGSSVGGLVAHNAGTITNCYSTGNVTGTGSSVGGLVGVNGMCWPCPPPEENCQECVGWIYNCYSTGAVSDTGDYVGGLVGYNYGGTITNCYSTGNVTGTGSYVGGLVGEHVIGEVGDSFWDIESSEQSTSAGGTPKTTAEMKTQTTFSSAGWDFIGETANGTEDIWAICEGTNYSRFVYQIPQGDIMCPDGVNSFDFSLLARYWHETDCAALDDCDGADIDLSGAVDFGDVAAVAESWLSGVE